MKINEKQALELLKRLQADAIYADTYLDDIIADYRYSAEYNVREILNTLINLEFEESANNE